MRILLVEDHPLVVEGLRICIGADHQIAHVIGNGDEVLPWLQWNEVDLVTLDLALPNRSGFELLPDIRALSRPPKVLVVSMHDHTHMREAVQKSGAHGFISKDATVELSRQAIAEIAAGGTWFPDRSEEDRSRGRSSRWAPNLKLTKRQSDVLYSLGDDLSRKATASRLHISEYTVDEHLAALRKEFRVATNPALIRAAMEAGFIPQLSASRVRGPSD